MSVSTSFNVLARSSCAWSPFRPGEASKSLMFSKVSRVISRVSVMRTRLEQTAFNHNPCQNRCFMGLQNSTEF